MYEFGDVLISLVVNCGICIKGTLLGVQFLLVYLELCGVRLIVVWMFI